MASMQQEKQGRSSGKGKELLPSIETTDFSLHLLQKVCGYNLGL
jgi:hypothetical protein